MNAKRNRRNHPLAQLVVWLAVCSVSLVFALVYVVGKLPSSDQLESTHMEGLKVGYGLCLEDQEPKPQQRIAKPVLIGGSL